LTASVSTDARLSTLWREASLTGAIPYAQVTPTAQMTFDGSYTFAIRGTPIVRYTAVIEAGVERDLGHATKLGRSYTGQFGSGMSSRRRSIFSSDFPQFSR